MTGMPFKVKAISIRIPQHASRIWTIYRFSRHHQRGIGPISSQAPSQTYLQWLDWLMSNVAQWTCHRLESRDIWIGKRCTMSPSRDRHYKWPFVDVDEMPIKPLLPLLLRYKLYLNTNVYIFMKAYRILTSLSITWADWIQLHNVQMSVVYLTKN